MKDPKNIEALNSLVISYMSMHGMQGIALDSTDPFNTYYMSGLMGTIFSSSVHVAPIVPNNLVHSMLEYAYDLYLDLDNIRNMVNPTIKEEILTIIGDLEFDQYIDTAIHSYKEAMFFIFDNYNSKRESYNEMKLDLMKDRLEEFVQLEEYSEAAIMRDKIIEFEK